MWKRWLLIGGFVGFAIGFAIGARPRGPADFDDLFFSARHQLDMERGGDVSTVIVLGPDGEVTWPAVPLWARFVYSVDPELLTAIEEF